MTKEKRPDKTCLECGRKMKPGHPTKKFCTNACRQKYYRRQKAEA